MKKKRNKMWLVSQRKKHKLSQKELSRLSGLSPSTIEQIEQDKRKGSSSTWEKIEQALDKLETGQTTVPANDQKDGIVGIEFTESPHFKRMMEHVADQGLPLELIVYFLEFMIAWWKDALEYQEELFDPTDFDWFDIAVINTVKIMESMMLSPEILEKIFPIWIAAFEDAEDAEDEDYEEEEEEPSVPRSHS